MVPKTRAAVRRSQTITTFGVGALIDLPERSAIVGGLEHWEEPPTGAFEAIHDPRLARRLANLADLKGNLPKLCLPPSAPDFPGQQAGSVAAFIFPEWFVVQERGVAGDNASGVTRETSRPLVPRTALDQRWRFRGSPVVATRFVRACTRGHVDDIRWREFVHQNGSQCNGELRMIEGGTTGDLAELRIGCSCGKSRAVVDAKDRQTNPLGTCDGNRPWLGRNAHEDCDQPARLLIRTASNAWFPQIVSALSLPDLGTELDRAVRQHWSFLDTVENAVELTFAKKKSFVANALADVDDNDVLDAIRRRRSGDDTGRPMKLAELDALSAVPEGFGDDIPVDPDFHARRLPGHMWRQSEKFVGRVEAVVQVHRLREVMALAGFTRLEAAMPGIDGDYETDVERATLERAPSWFPAIENRGEGVFVKLDSSEVRKWMKRGEVKQRLSHLGVGHQRWCKERNKKRKFHGGPYLLLHTFSHLLLQSVSLRCGYPAASIRERIYLDEKGQRYGLLLYTASADAEGTLGGLVQQARAIEEHLEAALETARLCSNDPVCAQHEPGESMEQRWLHGAACHGCALVAETSCEMRNDYLDRALVAPVLGCEGAAFFPK